MKLVTSCLMAFVAAAYALEDRGCVNIAELEDDSDLFPVKVTPTHSEYWDVEYFNTYKIVSNTIADRTYLLYQCGTEPPADQLDGRHDAVLEIPLTDVAISSTPMISYMEQLGLTGGIKAFLSSATYVNSPCFAADIESGKVSSLDRGDDETAPSFSDASLFDQTKLTSFVSSFEATSPPPLSNNPVVVSENRELTSNAMFEWVKFFAVFFNMEELANQVFEAAESRFDCVSKNAGQIAADAGERPKLLWAYYSLYCGGWDVGECPNYYCEYAEACSADIMGSSEGTNAEAKEKCGATYMTDEEFFAHAKDADYWFFPSADWKMTEELYKDSLGDIKAYREKQVFDYMGRGSNTWFEQRFAEYYKVVEDMCHTLGVKGFLVGRQFWRNVFTEDVPPGGLDAPCDEDAAANILTDPDTCVPVERANIQTDDTSAAVVQNILLGIALTVGAFFVL